MESIVTRIEPIGEKVVVNAADVFEGVVVRGVERSTISEEEAVPGQQIEHLDLSRADNVAVVAEEDVLIRRDEGDVVVAIIRIHGVFWQTRMKGCFGEYVRVSASVESYTSICAFEKTRKMPW